jgi:outer membrane lipoprotein SlyB
MKSHKKIAWLLALLCGTLLASGCMTRSTSAGSYTPHQAQREMSVRFGVVESVRQVVISGEKSGAGSMAGAAVGGIAGSNIGGGRGAAVGAILGMVGGAMAGHAIEESATERPGLEITIRFDDGKISAITQQADEQFRPGERIRVLTGGGVTRVTH